MKDQPTQSGQGRQPRRQGRRMQLRSSYLRLGVRASGQEMRVILVATESKTSKARKDQTR